MKVVERVDPIFLTSPISVIRKIDTPEKTSLTFAFWQGFRVRMGGNNGGNPLDLMTLGGF